MVHRYQQMMQSTRALISSQGAQWDPARCLVWQHKATGGYALEPLAHGKKAALPLCIVLESIILLVLCSHRGVGWDWAHPGSASAPARTPR